MLYRYSIIVPASEAAKVHKACAFVHFFNKSVRSRKRQKNPKNDKGFCYTVTCVFALFAFCLCCMQHALGATYGEVGAHRCLCRQDACVGQNDLLHVGHVAHFVEPKCFRRHDGTLHVSRTASRRARLRGGPVVAAVTVLGWLAACPDCCWLSGESGGSPCWYPTSPGVERCFRFWMAVLPSTGLRRTELFW